MASRAGLDATMDERFTTGPVPWGVSYSDKKAVGLANFVSTVGAGVDTAHVSGEDTGFTLGTDCVPAGATITSAKVRVTHAIIDPDIPTASNYAARIRVFNGAVFTPFDLTGNNLVGGGRAVPDSEEGIANEVTTDATAGGGGDIDVFSILYTVATVNGAVIQFQANRSGAALRTILNEISLIVDYSCPESGCGGDGGSGELTKLVTGGGFVAGSTPTYSAKTAHFGFNARSSSTGAPVPGTGTFEYNDGKLQMKGTVDTIDTCDTSDASFTFSGTYVARIGTSGKIYNGDFTVSVVDVSEPGKGADTIGLALSAGTGIPGVFSGFPATTTLSKGNIQFHFCDL